MQSYDHVEPNSEPSLKPKQFETQFQKLLDSANAHESKLLKQVQIYESNNLLFQCNHFINQKCDTLTLLKQLNETLFLLSTHLNFEEIGRFTIRILADYKEHQTQEPLYSKYIFEILRNLSALKNLQQLEVLEHRQNQWNPFLFYLFSSYEISSPYQNYIYQSSGKTVKLTVLFFNKTAENNIIKYCQSFRLQFSDTEEINAFQRCMQSSKQFSCKIKQQYLNLVQGGGLFTQKKQMQILVNSPNMSFQSKMFTILDLLQTFDQDYPRITKVLVQIQTENVSQSVSSNEIIQNNHLTNMFPFQSLQISNKLQLNILNLYPSIYSALTSLLQTIKGLRIILRFNQDYSNLPVVLKEIPPQHTTNLKVIYVTFTKQQQLSFLPLFPECFRHLSKYIIKLYIPIDNINLSLHIESLLESSSRIDHLNFGDLIQFRKSKLSILHFARENQFDQVTEAIIKSIINFNKPINFQIQFNTEVENPTSFRKIIQVSKKYIEIKNIVEFNVYTSFQNEGFNQILNERNSQLISIVSFDLFLSPFMLFNPKAILLDLFD